MEDCGEYSVIARNLAGDARTSCHVYVTGSSPWQPADAAAAGLSETLNPPGFTAVFDDVTVDIGEPCTLRVTVAGNPLPQVFFAEIFVLFKMFLPDWLYFCFQCFDTVGWVAGRESGLKNFCFKTPGIVINVTGQSTVLWAVICYLVNQSVSIFIVNIVVKATTKSNGGG